MTRELRLALALALPLVVLVVGAVRAQLQYDGSRDYVFRVEGRDPRDLLRGRYLRVRLAYDGTDGDCICVQDGERLSAVRIPCDETRRCDDSIPREAIDDIRRYFLAEELASPAEDVLADAVRDETATAVVGWDGSSATIKQLLIDGEPIEEVAARPQPTEPTD